MKIWICVLLDSTGNPPASTALTGEVQVASHRRPFAARTSTVTGSVNKGIGFKCQRTDYVFRKLYSTAVALAVVLLQLLL
jgi:hypothetical protein